MAEIPSKFANKIYNFQRPNRWTAGVGAALPEAYKKFWREWKLTTPTPVHYIPKEGKYEMVNGVVQPVQNVPLPLKYPKELDEGIWGGEAVVMGFIKKNKYKRRFRRYWVPQIKRSVVYSEILDKYMRTIVTERAIKLIHENYGFDHYILKTKACDLRSLLAVRLKREMLVSLHDKTLYPDDEVKRNQVYDKYKKYLEDYTREEIEWYGLSFAQAHKKYISLDIAAIKFVPLKVTYRQELIKKLEEAKLEGSGEETQKSWLSKLNPFSSNKSSTVS